MSFAIHLRPCNVPMVEPWGVASGPSSRIQLRAQKDNVGASCQYNCRLAAASLIYKLFQLQYALPKF
ncbi:hypothetical protein Ancab_002115 [Ancistrocladus abbreviatus]